MIPFKTSSLLPFLISISFLFSACGTPGPAGETDELDDDHGIEFEETETDPIQEEYQVTAEQIIERAMQDDHAWQRMAELVDYFPHRLSGSQMLEDAIDWSVEQMEEDGFPEIRTQEVEVPHWERGEEWAKLNTPVERNLRMLGLGNTPPTPEDGITEEAIVVESFDELEERSDEVEGKIVVFNAEFTNYGETVQYRTQGPARASEKGAVAALIRSVTPKSHQHPHTGNSGFPDGVEPIPTAALTVEDVKYMQRMQDRGESLEIELYMESNLHDEPAISRNVIAEIPGSEKPEEIVVLGGHIDSWDIGQGAMDDAGGVAVTWEALRVIHEMELEPRRTIRLVLWTNEENGVEGGRAYRDKIIENGELEDHVLAMESDFGTFEPLGYGFGGSDEAMEMLRPIANLMEPIGATRLDDQPLGTVDLGPLEDEGVPIMGFHTDTEKYFWYHHSEKDTPDKLDPEEMAGNVAKIAVMAYVVADMEERLPR